MQFIEFYLRPNSSYGHLIRSVERHKKAKTQNKKNLEVFLLQGNLWQSVTKCLVINIQEGNLH